MSLKCIGHFRRILGNVSHAHVKNSLLHNFSLTFHDLPKYINYDNIMSTSSTVFIYTYQIICNLNHLEFDFSYFHFVLSVLNSMLGDPLSKLSIILFCLNDFSYFSSWNFSLIFSTLFSPADRCTIFLNGYMLWIWCRIHLCMLWMYFIKIG